MLRARRVVADRRLLVDVGPRRLVVAYAADQHGALRGPHAGCAEERHRLVLGLMAGEREQEHVVRRQERRRRARRRGDAQAAQVGVPAVAGSEAKHRACGPACADACAQRTGAPDDQACHRFTSI